MEPIVTLRLIVFFSFRRHVPPLRQIEKRLWPLILLYLIVGLLLNCNFRVLVGFKVSEVLFERSVVLYVYLNCLFVQLVAFVCHLDNNCVLVHFFCVLKLNSRLRNLPRFFAPVVVFVLQKVIPSLDHRVPNCVKPIFYSSKAAKFGGIYWFRFRIGSHPSCN
jgi:hypothetical protein